MELLEATGFPLGLGAHHPLDAPAELAAKEVRDRLGEPELSGLSCPGEPGSEGVELPAYRGQCELQRLHAVLAERAARPCATEPANTIRAGPLARPASPWGVQLDDDRPPARHQTQLADGDRHSGGSGHKLLALHGCYVARAPPARATSVALLDSVEFLRIDR